VLFAFQRLVVANEGGQKIRECSENENASGEEAFALQNFQK